MKAEIIAVGTELLLGQIVNTNAQYLSQELAFLGIDVYFQTVVGDNLGRLKQAITIAQNRADVIVFSGGLGPTQDDLTKDAIAEVLGRKMYIDEDAMAKIEALFKGRGTVMTENNRRQALIIEGSDPLPNETGLALGNAISQDGKYYIILPGPPKELIPMFDHQAKPWIVKHVLTSEMPLFSKMLKFAGIGESLLEEKLIDLIQNQTDPTIAPYAKEGEVTIRLSTKAPTKAEANVKLNEMEAKIKARLPQHLYANIDVPIEHTIVHLMADQGLTLSAAESCTGGMVMETITSIAGSSSVLKGGFVTYTNEMKEQLLGVPHHLLEGTDAPGAVSAETAQEMAERVRTITNSDFGLSVTGVAGPGESEGKPAGLVYIGIAEKGKETEVHQLKLHGNRESVRNRAVKAILYRLWLKLQS
ncbi:competence/damage-inducible protein A [Paenibacillus sediminis]|uniref:Putative competence-damage inducible protein n=1 Tax=Paenibacillus sediminis TaxID=664909 RepID=A0ABS4H1K9_9BACL|nr:competence/damage-inducible protein A [Paenibacillus sediminis]MBP1936351.1 nicotinamide-nucleotide amidase [Paenibacillus sediminis]